MVISVFFYHSSLIASFDYPLKKQFANLFCYGLDVLLSFCVSLGVYPTREPITRLDGQMLPVFVDQLLLDLVCEGLSPTFFL
jgi:hypothetical protein